MKIFSYFENTIKDLTQNPNSNKLRFINRVIPNVSSLLQSIDYFAGKTEIIPNLTKIDRIKNIGIFIRNNERINKDLKSIYANVLIILAENLKITVKEYISNVDAATNLEYEDEDNKKESSDNQKIVLLNAYCIYKIIDSIIKNEKQLNEKDKEKLKEAYIFALEFFERNIKLLKIFEENFGNYFFKFPQIIKKSKVLSLINQTSTENKSYQQKVKSLNEKQVYYFKYNSENKSYYVIKVDVHFDSRNETYYDFILKQGNEDGQWVFIDSPLIRTNLGVKFNQNLFNKLNKENNKKEILSKLYLINDPKSLQILDNNKTIKNILIDGNSMIRLDFDPNDQQYKLPENIKLGVLRVE